MAHEQCYMPTHSRPRSSSIRGSTSERAKPSTEPMALKYSSPVEGCSPLPIVAELGSHLVASSPVRPQKYLPLSRHTHCRKPIQQPAYLRYGQGQERFFGPLFKASFERTTLTKACASKASVACLCQASHFLTSYSARPNCSLADSKHNSICQRVIATRTTSSSVVLSLGAKTT